MGKKICILLSILWMIVIFYLSNQSSMISSIHSSEVINIISKLPLIGYVMKYLTSVNLGVFVVRKIAHMFLYCILAILIFIINKDDIKKSAIISFLIVFLYACSDEFHQLFITGRSGEIRDVMIDSIGAIVGVIIISSIYKLKYSTKK